MDAKNNPELRQEYLDGFDMEKYSQFVKDISYIDILEGNRGMESIPRPSINNCPVISDINVSDLAFRIHPFNEFYNIMVHHEGFHSLQSSSDQTLLSDRTLIARFPDMTKMKFSEKRINIEIGAYKNQIHHPSFSRCSPKFQEYVYKQLKFHEKISGIILKIG